MKNILLKLLVIITVLFTGINVANATSWDYSKSKKSTELDENNEINVSLSLPSAEEELVSDIVFVLDYSQNAASVAEKGLSVLDELNESINNSKASIKVGAVVFRGNANEKTFDLVKYDDSVYEELKSFLNSSAPSTKGSNIHAGLIKGEEMLDNDTTTSSSRKYLILISDGNTYTWSQDGTDQYGAAHYVKIDNTINLWAAGTSIWEIMHPSLKWAPDDWNAYLDNLEENINNTLNDKTDVYTRNKAEIDPSKAINWDENDKYASSIDVALYKTREKYNEIASKYNTYVYAINTYNYYGYTFMQSLGNNISSFDIIKKDVYYLLDAGSSVEDYMGKDFDLVEDSFELTVNGEKLESTKEENVYYFGQDDAGNYRFKVTYTSGENEKFVWEINEAVSNFEPVVLSYKEKFIKEEFTEAGEQTTEANESATLTPVDSNEETHDPEEFEKPEVKYTVGKVTTEYVTDEGKTLSDNVETFDLVGKNYTTTEKTFDGYELIDINGNTSGVYTKEDITVTYIYQYVHGEGDVEPEDSDEIIPPQTGLSAAEYYGIYAIYTILAISGFILYKKEN